MTENYSDPSDMATRHEELFVDIALKQRKPAGPEATGCCLWCEEPVADGRRWCGPECRDFFEIKNRR